MRADAKNGVNLFKGECPGAALTSLPDGAILLMISRCPGIVAAALTREFRVIGGIPHSHHSCVMRIKEIKE